MIHKIKTKQELALLLVTAERKPSIATINTLRAIYTGMYSASSIKAKLKQFEARPYFKLENGCLRLIKPLQVEFDNKIYFIE